MTTRRPRLVQSLALAAAGSFLAACAGGTGAGPTVPGATQASGGTVGATAIPPLATLSATAPAAGAIDACSLLSSTDIKELTGYEVGSMNPAPMDTIFSHACEWTLKGTPYLIALGVESTAGQAAWDRLVPYTQGDAVSGIGDQAFHAEMGGDLMVRSGDTFFDIQYVAPGAPKDIQGKLAERVVANLP